MLGSELFTCCFCYALLKSGQAIRARAFFDNSIFTYQPSYLTNLTDISISIYLDEDISTSKLNKWKRLEFQIPLDNSIELGIYYNCLAVTYLRLNKVNEARIIATKSLQNYHQAKLPGMEFYMQIHLAFINCQIGNLRDTQYHLRIAKNYSRRSANNEHAFSYLADVVEVSYLWEMGRYNEIQDRSDMLFEKLVNLDSWQDLFLELSRITTFATYFSQGAEPALRHIQYCQDYFYTKHSHFSPIIDGLEAIISAMEGHIEDATLNFGQLTATSFQSCIGQLVNLFLSIRLAPEKTAEAFHTTPPRYLRNKVLKHISLALQAKHNKANQLHRKHLVKAIRLAQPQELIAPFLEHREVFSGLKTWLANASFSQGDKRLARFCQRINAIINNSYLLPEKIKTHGLSIKQMRVLIEINKGNSNKVIAKKLGVSEAAIKYHVTKLLKAYQVQRRGQLAEVAIAN